jgi:hypothetical protein
LSDFAHHAAVTLILPPLNPEQLQNGAFIVVPDLVQIYLMPAAILTRRQQKVYLGQCASLFMTIRNLYRGRRTEELTKVSPLRVRLQVQQTNQF